MLKRLLMPTFLFACAVTAQGANSPVPVPSPKPEKPEVFKMISKAAALEIVKRFDTDFGLIGWAVRVNDEPTILYTTPDGKHVVVGRVFDMSENDLTLQRLRQYFPDTGNQAANQAAQPRQIVLTDENWRQIKQADWIAEGAANPEKIVYVFFDPYCRHCHRFWWAARSYETDHGLQVRYIPVAILGAESRRAAAKLLTSKTPRRSLSDWIRLGKPIEGNASPSDVVRVDRNTDLMLSLGFSGTPVIMWRDKDRKIRYFVGMPTDKAKVDAMLLADPGKNRGDKGDKADK